MEKNLYKKEILILIELLRTLRLQMAFLSENEIVLEQKDYLKICKALDMAAKDMNTFKKIKKRRKNEYMSKSM